MAAATTPQSKSKSRSSKKKKLSATMLKDINDVPEGFETRKALSERWGEIPAHRMSYAATTGQLGPVYYAVGQVGYYNTKEATKLWGTPQARGAITRAENGTHNSKKTAKSGSRRSSEEAPTGVRTAPDPLPAAPNDAIIMLNMSEAALVSGRTLDELQELITAGTFISHIGVTGDGSPMWVKSQVIAWTAKYPPEPISMVFDGAGVRVSRHILPGVYTLTRVDLPKPATST